MPLKNEYSKIFNYFQGAIIPHAGFDYAGQARATVFRNLSKNDRQSKFIIYIAALHKNVASSNKVFVLHQDKGFTNYFKNTKSEYTNELSNGAKKEHSFEWVKKELRGYFPKYRTSILVLCPTPSSDLKLLAQDIINFINKKGQINNKGQINKVLLFATTDLTHYGSRFNNIDMLDYPQQLGKWRKEERLIDDIKNVKSKLQKEDLKMMCGPNAVRTFLYVASFFKWKGKVDEYYDSYGIEKPLLIDRYSIDFGSRRTEFVSYVSIVFGNFRKPKDILLPIDINMAIGCVKSVIHSKVIGHSDECYLPIWNNFYHKQNGIFVGTEILLKNGQFKTNCSYGRYQNDEGRNRYDNSATKILDASGNCIRDASQRWNIPYTVNNLKSMSYKVEILEDKRKWKKYKSHFATDPKKFPFDGKHGMLLTLYNDNSATYLPVVAKDNKNKWSVTDYMEHLSKKAGGRKDDWKHKDSEMLVYKSVSYIFYPNINEVIVK